MFPSPTIKDIAREAGLHFTTISMALRGHPHISARTRDRVRALAERMGYRRNPVYAALTQHRVGAKRHERPPKLAFIANRTPDDGFFEPAYRRRLVEGVRQQASAMGYDVDVLFLGKGQHTCASLERYLKKEAISGIVIGAFEPHLPNLEVDLSDLSIVKIDSRHMAPAATFVSNDQMGAVRLAFHELRALGYRRVGIAVGAIDEEGTDHLYLSGYYLEQAGLPESERVQPLVFPMGTVDQGRVVPLLRHWAHDERVDAVMCNWTSVRAMLRLAGFNSPAELASCCLYLTTPINGLAGVRVDAMLVGQRAVSLLVDLVRADRHGVPACPTHTYIGCFWQPGSSAPISRAATAPAL